MRTLQNSTEIPHKVKTVEDTFANLSMINDLNLLQKTNAEKNNRKLYQMPHLCCHVGARKMENYIKYLPYFSFSGTNPLQHSSGQYADTVCWCQETDIEKK